MSHSTSNYCFFPKLLLFTGQLLFLKARSVVIGVQFTVHDKNKDPLSYLHFYIIHWKLIFEKKNKRKNTLSHSVLAYICKFVYFFNQICSISKCIPLFCFCFHNVWNWRDVYGSRCPKKKTSHRRRMFDMCPGHDVDCIFGQYLKCKRWCIFYVFLLDLIFYLYTTVQKIRLCEIFQKKQYFIQQGYMKLRLKIQYRLQRESVRKKKLFFWTFNSLRNPEKMFGQTLF